MRSNEDSFFASSKVWGFEKILDEEPFPGFEVGSKDLTQKYSPFPGWDENASISPEEWKKIVNALDNFFHSIEICHCWQYFIDSNQNRPNNTCY